MSKTGPGRLVLISSSHSSSDFMGFHGLSGAIETEPIKGNFETEELQISLASIKLMVFTMSNNTRVSSGAFHREIVIFISVVSKRNTDSIVVYIYFVEYINSKTHKIWADHAKILLIFCAFWRATKWFPRYRLQRKPLLSDPDKHHGTCVTHVPWCMSGSLTHGGGENVPGIPGACATRNFTYLVTGP